MATSQKTSGGTLNDQSVDQRVEQNIKTLSEKIHGIRVAMLTTIDPDGVLRSRPMATQDLDFDGRLWFFTGKQSGKVHSIESDQHVNVSYVSTDDNRYVSVAGKARVVQDQDKVNELWNPLLKAWFPKGPQDPDISLICVDVESAEYWDAPSSKLVKLMGFTKAVLTGQRYESAGENERVDVRH